ncbi:DUF2079 domain-containing protein [Candidatus Falkowbacteria bacterium]|nr:DUF2079 domain-containing protein [Candidatus Falkowbacteria bacterium]
MIKYFRTIDWLKLAKLTWILMAIYIAFTFSICLFKYFTFLYHAMDLAIFNQVFYNSSLGNFFHFTIHPTSYLGDHFKPLILFLIPFYSLYKSPLVLLFLQTIFITLAAIPLFLICKNHLSPLQSLLVILLYLFNPVTMDINLFEFHMLPLAIFFLFYAYYFYDQNKFKPFIIFILLSLLIREDIPLAIFMFGILAIIERKKLKWILSPMILSAIYFLLALKIIAHFSTSGSYKFFVNYSWLGNNPLEMIENVFIKFPEVLQKIMIIQNLEIVLGFFMVFLFIPLYRPKNLLLCLGYFLGIIFILKPGDIVFKTHYATVFIAVFCLSTIFSIKALSSSRKFMNFYEKSKDVLIIVLISAFIYIFLTLGPLLPFIKIIFITDYEKVKLRNEFIEQIPESDSVITGYDFLTYLSSRKKLYALNYVFLGRQQYNVGDYIVPNDTQYLLVDFNDITGFHLQYQNTVPTYYYEGDNNLKKLLREKNLHLKMLKNNIALWQKDYNGAEPVLYEIYENRLPDIKTPQETSLGGKIKFLGYNKEGDKISLFFKPLQKIDKNYFLKINGVIQTLGYGLYPTSEWQTNQIIQINFYDMPIINDNILLIDIMGGFELTGVGSIKKIIDTEKILGEFAVI